MSDQDNHRANFLGIPAFYNLNLAACVINEAFESYGTYLVGSSLERRDYRDVDVRVIMADEEYARLFPGLSGNAQVSAFWSLLCVSISEWMAARTGLPIDFQIQKQSEANEKYKVTRNAIGLFVGRVTR